MKYAQALKDYRTLRELVGGEPEDAGEMLEQIAERMLSKPTEKQALSELGLLIDMYFDRGSAEGADMRDMPEAREIFIRHGLINEDGEDE